MEKEKSDLFETRAAIGVWEGWNTDLVVMNEIPVLYELFNRAGERMGWSKKGTLPFHPPSTMEFNFGYNIPLFKIVGTQWQQTSEGNILVINLQTEDYSFGYCRFFSSYERGRLMEVGFKEF